MAVRGVSHIVIFGVGGDSFEFAVVIAGGSAPPADSSRAVTREEKGMVCSAARGKAAAVLIRKAACRN